MNQPRLWDTSILNMENSPVEAQCGPVYPFLKIYKMYVLTFVLENITLICVLELRFKFLCLVKKNMYAVSGHKGLFAQESGKQFTQNDYRYLA